MNVLAVDAGQSATRLRFRTPDGLLASDGRGLIAGRDPIADLVDILTGVLARTGWMKRLDVVSVGMTGLQGGPADAVGFLASCAARFGTSRVLVADDSLTSYVGALGMAPGVVLAAGTGVTVLAWDGARRHHKVDGWGYLLGDAGGGYWVGRAGLEQAMRAFDGRGGSTLLLDALRAREGDPARIPAQIIAEPDRVSRIAKFAREVGQVALAGDAVSGHIWTAAAHELAASLRAAADWLSPDGPVTVSWTGKLFDAGPLLVEPLTARLAEILPQASVVAAAGSSVDGALRLADTPATPDLHPLLTVASNGG